MSDRELHPSEIAKNEAITQGAIAERHYYEERVRLLRLEREAASRKNEDETAANERHNVYMFDQEVNNATVRTCIKQLLAWSRQRPGCDIEIIVNSPGGDIFEGLALVDSILYLRQMGHHVTTIAIGKAASMGGVLMQAGDTRVMGKHSLMLIHEGSLGAIGDFGKVVDRVKLMEKLHKRILGLFVERSNVSERFIRNRWERQDWWLTADDCLKHGFIDVIR